MHEGRGTSVGWGRGPVHAGRAVKRLRAKHTHVGAYTI